nr:methyl-accepting chemotaxis protein [Alteromonas sp. 5E99-2]
MIVSFTFVLLLFLAMTLVATFQVSDTDRRMTQINDVNSVKQRHAINFRGSVHDRAIAIRDVVLKPDENGVRQSISDIRKLEQFYIQSAGPLDQLVAQNASAEERSILNHIKQIEKDTLPLIEKIIDSRTLGNDSAAKKVLLEQASKKFTQWLGTINEFIDYQESINNKETITIREQLGSFTGLMYDLVIIAAVFLIFVVIFLLVGLKALLGGEPSKISAVIGEIAKGDLSVRCDNGKKGSILANIYAMQCELVNTVKGIRSVSARIQSSNNESANEQSTLANLINKQSNQAHLAHKQLENLKQQAARVKELLSETNTLSDTSIAVSKEGNESVTQSSVQIKSVKEAIGNTAQDIRELEKLSNEISTIASVISGISDQTNLLALNAAIEAARAGETGRGFAVVADEVRGLAQRTGDATKEIEDTLGTVQTSASSSLKSMESLIPKIESALETSENSTGALDEIEKTAYGSAKNLMKSIDEFSKQVVVLEELGLKMEEVVESSGELTSSSEQFVESNMKVANSLKGLSEELTKHTNYFNI